MRGEGTSFSRQVAIKAARKQDAQRSGAPSPLTGLGMFGMVGWSVAVPTVFGALLGEWLDSHHWNGHSWTLALLVAGLVLGCANAWRWVSNQNPEAAESAAVAESAAEAEPAAVAESANVVKRTDVPERTGVAEPRPNHHE